MIKYKQLTLIGTSHIAEQSIQEVRSAVEAEKPGIIAIELDKKRLAGLLDKSHKRLKLKEIFRLGVKAYLFILIASYIQKKLGRIVGVDPGSEMLEAVKLANKTKSQLALIDQDITITLYKFSKAFTWKERWNFFVDILKGLFFKKNQIKELGIDTFDITKVPSKKVIAKLLKNVKEGTVFKKPAVIKWHCRNCGYVVEGKEAPEKCPACDHPKAYYELFSENY